ncbi:hypothetical protein [Kocuria sabuli]|uniref:hypothetical protein n=1 Tax=Kocuria sabuli TaxID=3071448 RepID=UPI0034D6381F
MPRPAPTSRGRLLALAALAGTTAVTGTLAGATPAVAAPVAIAGYVSEIPEGGPETDAESHLSPVVLTNGDTAYGIHEDQPLAPAGKPVLDDESYTVAEPFDDPEAGWQSVVGEKAGDAPVYWEPENAALAGYILSAFGATDDADEALAVHRAVRSLSTAADRPLPGPSGFEQSHLDRAAFLVQDARTNVPSVTPQSSYTISVSFEPDGRPDTLLVQMPQAYYTTTVTLSGPVTFADGTTTRTFTGGDRDKYLELAVPAGVTEGEFTADLTATMPSTELTVLAHEQYRDLLIAGQERTLDWGASADFRIAAPSGSTPTAPTPPKTGAVDQDEALPDSSEGDDSSSHDNDTGSAPVAGDSPSGDPVDGKAITVAIPGGNRDNRGTGGGDLLVVDAPDTRTTAVVEAFVLFDEQTSTHTEVVTETTTTTGGAAYADPAMANTGMGAAATASGRGTATSVVLAAVAVVAALGAWALRRRPSVSTDRSA